MKIFNVLKDIQNLQYFKRAYDAKLKQMKIRGRKICRLS